MSVAQMTRDSRATTPIAEGRAPRLRAVREGEGLAPVRNNRSANALLAPVLRAVPTAPTPGEVPGLVAVPEPGVRSVRSSRTAAQGSHRSARPQVTRRAEAARHNRQEQAICVAPKGLRVAVRAAVGALVALAGMAFGSMFLPTSVESVVVQQGDTIWSIASTVDGAPSTAQAVSDIASLNGLGSEFIVAGQILEMPSY